MILSAEVHLLLVMARCSALVSLVGTATATCLMAGTGLSSLGNTSYYIRDVPLVKLESATAFRSYGLVPSLGHLASVVL